MQKSNPNRGMTASRVRRGNRNVSSSGAVVRAAVDALEARRLLAFDFTYTGNIGPGNFIAPRSFAVGDINGDGTQDFVFTNKTTISTQVGIRLGDARGNYTSLADLDSAGDKGDIALADLNHDGKLDLLVTGLNDGTLRVRLGNGNGTFGNESTAASFVEAASGTPITDYLGIGDFDGDGNLDAAGGSYFAGLRIAFGNGSGGFRSDMLRFDSVGGISSLEVVDTNNDNAPEIVFTSTNGANDLNILYNLRTPNPGLAFTSLAGGLNAETYLAVEKQTNGSVMFAVVEAEPSGVPSRVVTGRISNSSFTDVAQLPGLYRVPTRPTIADFDRDGVGDLAFTTIPTASSASGELNVFSGQSFGTPFYGSATKYVTGWNPYGAFAADMNSDGNADILVGILGRNDGFDDYNIFTSNQQSLVVSTTVDEDNGNARRNSGAGTSLLEAIEYARGRLGAQTITFSPFLGNRNSTLTVDSEIKIVGQLTAPITIQNNVGTIAIGSSGHRLFNITGLSDITLRNLTIQDAAADRGGAILADFFTTLTIENSTFRNNTATTGAAIYSETAGTLRIRNSTFTGNSGNGIIASAANTTLIEHTTIAGNNTFGSPSGGVISLGNTATLNNNIIANNNGADLQENGGGFAGTNNLITNRGSATLPANTRVDDPMLLALANNGGRTPTMMPRYRSPAINGGAQLGYAADQRGQPRPQFGEADVGAVEVSGTDQTESIVTAADGARWFLEPGAAAPGSDRKVYRQANGDTAIWVDGKRGSDISILNGEVVVRETSGAVSSRAGSNNGIGTTWNVVSSVSAGDGASWFRVNGPLGPTSIYRWAFGQTPTFSNGTGTRLGVLSNGTVVTQAVGDGAIFQRVGSSNGIGTSWTDMPTAHAGDGAEWFVFPDTSGTPNVFRWAENGTPTDTGISALRAGSLPDGTIVVATGSVVSAREGSSGGLGSAWITQSTAVANDDALWFAASYSNSNSKIYRWANNESPVDTDGYGTQVGKLADGRIGHRNADNNTYVRDGSPTGLGTGWSQMTTLAAGDGALWFLEPGAPQSPNYLHRWASGATPTYTGDQVSRLGRVGDGSIITATGNAIAVRIGSNGGVGSSPTSLTSVNAGDGAPWFLYRDIASTDPQIYRWQVGANAVDSNQRGITLFTVNGVVFTRTSDGGLYRRVGSNLGFGSTWEIVSESLVVTTANDELDVSSNAAFGSGTSLREALAFAAMNPGADTITFAPGLAGQTVTLSTGANGSSDDTALRLSTDLTIDGGAGVTIALASGTARRIFLNAGNLTLKNLNLSGGDLRGIDNGGALLNNASATLSNVHISNNKANRGGGIYNTGSLTVSNAFFDNNATAASNGEGGAIWNSGTLAISGTTFYQNTASSLGGAIVSFDGLTITDSNFSTNHSDSNGGALRLAGTSTISGSTFANNSAGNGGGAIISHGNTTITNTTIDDNNAADGAGIQFFEGTASLRHLTIAYNQATHTGGGIVINSADVTVVNTIVSGNAAPDQPNLWGASLNAASSHNLIGVDPAQLRLGALANNGGPTQTLALLPGSSAINAGISIGGIATDQRGTARPQGNAPDIGAYERLATTVQTTAASFEYDTRLAVIFNFSGDASVSITRGDIQLMNLDTQQLILAGTLSFNTVGTVGTLLLNNQLPDGNYRVTLNGATLDFFVLAGDFNHDRTVNFDDLVPLAQNYNKDGMNNLQGDANYDGVINYDDLVLLAANYNRTLLPAASLKAPGKTVKSRKP